MSTIPKWKEKLKEDWYRDNYFPIKFEKDEEWERMDRNADIIYGYIKRFPDQLAREDENNNLRIQLDWQRGETTALQSSLKEKEKEAAYWKALAIATDNAYISYRKIFEADWARYDPEGNAMEAAKAYEQYSIDKNKYEQLKNNARV